MTDMPEFGIPQVGDIVRIVMDFGDMENYPDELEDERFVLAAFRPETDGHQMVDVYPVGSTDPEGDMTCPYLHDLETVERPR